MSNQEIQILVAQAQNGSQLAFSKLYAPCYNAALAVCNGHVEAEDIAITAVGKAFHNIKTYKGEKATFLTFVGKIAKNILIDNYRKNKVHVCELDTNIQLAEQDSDIEQEHAARITILEKVLSKERDVVAQILQMKIDGKTEKQIGAELGMTRIAVQMAFGRFKDRVQAAR